MDAHFDNIKTVTFSEYIAVQPDQSNESEFDITIEGEMSSNAYCLAIFRKVLTIDLSEIVDFLDHHCEILKSPISWLNSLEKLLRFNQTWFNGDDQKFRQIKWGSEIISKRHDLKVATIQYAREHCQKRSLNGYTGDKIYSFEAVLESIKTMETAEEKILYIKAQIKNYNQNPPEWESNLKPKFDKQCKLEIDNLLEEEELLQKVKEKKAVNKLPLTINPKGKIYCNTNAFLDIVFQLTNELKVGSNPLLSISLSDLTDIICQNFRDKEGNPISRNTATTILDPNRSDKRPKAHKRYKVNDISE